MVKRTGILLFGGTFDPIHHGHLIVARSAAERLDVEKIILVPSAQPPHKLVAFISNAEHRLAMTKLAVQGDQLFEVSPCELQRTGPSYTLETVRHFRNLYGPAIALYWLIGADSISELTCWYQIDQLVDECTIVTAARPGCPAADLTTLQTVLNDQQIARLKANVLDDTPQIEISATDIRSRIADRRPIDYLVPPPVADYIAAHKLYQNN